jgi:hypothetical protein
VLGHPTDDEGWYLPPLEATWHAQAFFAASGQIDATETSCDETLDTVIRDQHSSLREAVVLESVLAEPARRLDPSGRI